MPSTAVEDYVKAIYLLQEESPTGEATVARIAATLGVTKGSVTAMVRKLTDAGLATSERYGGIRLTPRGRRLALDIVRRHRLIEVFLVDVLGLDWSEVHEEAERLEHAMSAKVLDRLDAFLGRPSSDPHGDPIPDAKGKVSAAEGRPLSELNAGESGVITRVSDQDPGFLEDAAARGLRPGVRVRVTCRDDTAAELSARCGRGREAPVPLAIARCVQVAVDRADSRSKV